MEKRHLYKLRRRWEDNIVRHLKEIRCRYEEFDWFDSGQRLMEKPPEYGIIPSGSVNH